MESTLWGACRHLVISSLSHHALCGRSCCPAVCVLGTNCSGRALQELDVHSGRALRTCTRDQLRWTCTLRTCTSNCWTPSVEPVVVRRSACSGPTAADVHSRKQFVPTPVAAVGVMQNSPHNASTSVLLDLANNVLVKQMTI